MCVCVYVSVARSGSRSDGVCVRQVVCALVGMVALELASRTSAPVELYGQVLKTKQ